MSSEIMDRLSKDPAINKLLDMLGEGLNSSDLQSVLIETARRRSVQTKVSGLVKEFKENRFLRPSDIPQSLFNKIDSLAYECLPENFKSIDFSPVSPFGSCSSVSNLSQNLVISTVRHSEVVSDPTNVMAIESALRRKPLIATDSKSSEIIKLSTSHRLIRAQPFGNEKFTAHFRVFALSSAGRDTGHFEFEISQLEEHLRFYLQLSKRLNILETAEVRLTDFSGKFNTGLMKPMIENLNSEFSGARVFWDNERDEARNYYTPLAFRIRYQDKNGDEWDIVDGGFNDWTQQYLNNQKERLLCSAIGTELLLKVFPGIMEKV